MKATGNIEKWGSVAGIVGAPLHCGFGQEPGCDSPGGRQGKLVCGSLGGRWQSRELKSLVCPTCGAPSTAGSDFSEASPRETTKKGGEVRDQALLSSVSF